jgi:hypothetical protein
MGLYTEVFWGVISVPLYRGANVSAKSVSSIFREEEKTITKLGLNFHGCIMITVF